MEIKELTPDIFWPLFKQHRSALFQDTIYYNSTDVWTAHEKTSFEELKKGMEGRKELFLGVYEHDEFIGWSASCQLGTMNCT